MVANCEGLMVGVSSTDHLQICGCSSGQDREFTSISCNSTFIYGSYRIWPWYVKLGIHSSFLSWRWRAVLTFADEVFLSTSRSGESDTDQKQGSPSMETSPESCYNWVLFSAISEPGLAFICRLLWDLPFSGYATELFSFGQYIFTQGGMIQYVYSFPEMTSEKWFL